MSRKHPGTSDAYNKKIKVRKMRKHDRAILRLAKEKFYRENGEEAELNRVAIRRFKKILN